jgi:7-keto-8-aminopelargonate synthetase-like enzyme
LDGVQHEGDIARLPEICRLAEKHGAAVMVDDAHAIGVLGDTAPEQPVFGLTERCCLIMGTFGKSLAGRGFIAADAATIDILGTTRPLIFSASMAPANVALSWPVRIIIEEPERIAQLWRNTGRMKAGLGLGFDLGASQSPILPVCRSLVIAFRLSKRLHGKGYL